MSEKGFDADDIVMVERVLHHEYQYTLLVIP